jgi:hypothetical protein
MKIVLETTLKDKSAFVLEGGKRNFSVPNLEKLPFF